MLLVRKSGPFFSKFGVFIALNNSTKGGSKPPEPPLDPHLNCNKFELLLTNLKASIGAKSAENLSVILK